MFGFLLMEALTCYMEPSTIKDIHIHDAIEIKFERISMKIDILKKIFSLLFF